MKKLFSFISVFALAATLGISTVSAQKTVATVEKLWSKTVAEVGATIADTRQGTGVDGKVYLLNKANQSLVAISAEGQDTVLTEVNTQNVQAPISLPALGSQNSASRTLPSRLESGRVYKRNLGGSRGRTFK